MLVQTPRDVVPCSPPDTRHLTGCGYLFGYPLQHSMSPLLHRTIFNALELNSDYFLLPSTDISQFIKLIRRPQCYGSGVTMPHKVDIIPWLDEVTPECQAIGACNTVFKRGDRLIGTNTDVIGVRESFFQAVPRSSWAGRPGLVIGGGGAARSAVYALVKHMGCRTIYLVNRDRDEVKAVMDWCKAQGYGDGLIDVETEMQAEQLEGAGAIVSCIPNYPPKTESEWEVRRIIERFLQKPHKGALLEMCYHPTPRTEIGDLAKQSGWNLILGTEAMLYQGLEQAQLWTGKNYSDLPVQQVKSVIKKELGKSYSSR